MVLKICTNQDVILILEFGSMAPNANVFSFLCFEGGGFFFFLQNYHSVSKKNVFYIDLVKSLCPES